MIPGGFPAVRLAELMRMACERHAFTRHGIRQTVSIGVAGCPGPSRRETLLSDAQECLQRAKSSGRDRVVQRQPPGPRGSAPRGSVERLKAGLAGG